ncbi:response regulator [Natrarchaeobaculum aegyptiacum]|uniref:histidine kinase n=1 Tax=Natrarchaeobaculum aegyptiacum TaxID=745377 RepID=A0A2Z2HRI5_9EURY|nr:response regulator [Natrarchaeobaculum aegyptiacum]ARS89679.1 hybrid sensor histidine kinase/response regulator [Natrarchaeobaculum aegyptiacum]
MRTEADEPGQVLYVDDDETLLELTAATLETTSLSVETESDPTRALERVRDGSYDCLVTDYEMPGLSGIELLESVRDVGEDLPVILFTATGSEAVASEAFAAGATGYVTKGRGTDQFELLRNQIRKAVVQHRTRRELERKTAAMDEAPVGITITDPGREDNPLIYVNQQFERLTGYPREEILGRNCRFLQGERTEQGPVDEMRAAIDAREPVSVVLRNYRRDGTMFWNEVTIAPIGETGDGSSDDDHGSSEGDDAGSHYFVGFQRDVTRRKMAEDRLRRQNERLEEFSGTVSHDLRGPLTVASGYLELARDEIDGEIPHVEAIQTAHERMGSLIDDLLERARAGTIVDDVEPVSLAEALETAWHPPPTVEATLNVAVDEDVTVPADETRLVQLLENLFGNAVEHGATVSSVEESGGETGDVTAAHVEAGDDDERENGDESERGHAGSPRVTVTAGLLEDGFYVEDDGPGIDPESREQVFESGYTTGSDGFGLGLQLVRDVVDAHGWEIGILEAAGGGSRFEISQIDGIRGR